MVLDKTFHKLSSGIIFPPCTYKLLVFSRMENTEYKKEFLRNQLFVCPSIDT